MRNASLALMLSSVMAVGCSSNNAHIPDGGHVDAITYDLAIDLPPGCPSGQANGKGIGKTCTHNGHECSSPLLCTCDTNSGLTLNGLPCICTIAQPNPQPNNPDPCSTQSPGVCGSGATCCNYVNAGFYCSPDICLPGGQCIQFVAADSGT